MTVFNLEMKRNMGGLISWIVVFSVMIAVMMVLQSMSDSLFNPETFASRVEAMPAIVSGILGLSIAYDLSQPYMFAAYMFQFVMLFSGIYACMMGARALSGEESRGTIEFLYSLPLSRGSILRQKVAAAAVRYIIYCIVLFAVTCGMIWFLNRDMSISGIVIDMIRVFICQLIIGFTYMSFGFLISALFRSNAESISVALAFVLITHIVGMLGNIMPHLGFLKLLSPVHAVLPIETLINGFDLIGAALCGVAIVATLLLASIRYGKKDFLV
ncbi:MAG: ABC transporter permease subunit [Firmicutes bacterium]|nr:ABC transporter permease subunit [Bacillota bacterium]